MFSPQNGSISFPVAKSRSTVLQNELLFIVLHPIEHILQALKLYEIIGHAKGLEWTHSRSLIARSGNFSKMHLRIQVFINYSALPSPQWALGLGDLLLGISECVKEMDLVQYVHIKNKSHKS